MKRKRPCALYDSRPKLSGIPAYPLCHITRSRLPPDGMARKARCAAITPPGLPPDRKWREKSWPLERIRGAHSCSQGPLEELNPQNQHGVFEPPDPRRRLQRNEKEKRREARYPRRGGGGGRDRKSRGEGTVRKERRGTD